MRALADLLLFLWYQPWALIAAGLLNIVLRLWTGNDIFNWWASAFVMIVGAGLTVARWTGAIK